MRVRFNLSTLLTYVVVSLTLLVFSLLGHYIFFAKKSIGEPPKVAFPSPEKARTSVSIEKKSINDGIDEVFYIYGRLKQIDQQGNKYYFIVVTEKNEQSSELRINMGIETAFISESSRKDNQSDEIHTVKTIKELSNLYNDRINEEVIITILAYTGAKPQDPDCDTTCKQYLENFESNKIANNNFYDDLKSGSIKSQYSLGSPVEISLQ